MEHKVRSISVLLHPRATGSQRIGLRLVAPLRNAPRRSHAVGALSFWFAGAPILRLTERVRAATGRVPEPALAMRISVAARDRAFLGSDIGLAPWLSTVAMLIGLLAQNGCVQERPSADRRNAELDQTPRSVPSQAPAVGSRGPTLPARAKGVGWHCIKNAQFENMSTCFRTMEQCKTGRAGMVAGGMQYTGCLPQEGAACFTFYSVVRQTDSFDCAATMAGCERQRRYALGQGSDVRDLSGCGVLR